MCFLNAYRVEMDQEASSLSPAKGLACFSIMFRGEGWGEGALTITHRVASQMTFSTVSVSRSIS